MTLAIGLAVSLVVTPLAIVLARRIGLMDRPGPLKIHEHPVPYLGGIGVLAATAAGLAPDRPDLVSLLLLAPALALFLGTVDDAVNLPPAGRLAAQAVTGLLVALVVDTRIPDPADYLVVIVVVIVVMNGMNFLDGLDGLAGGMALVTTAGFVIVFGGAAETLALALAGGLLGFLAFNRPPARIYLGDGGSYLLGSLIALMLALCWRNAVSTTTSIGALLLVLWPVAEVGFAVLRRARVRRSPFVGDRRHSYDLLLRSGRTPVQTVLICVGIQAVLALIGGIAAELPRGPAIAVTATAGAALLTAGVAGGMVTPEPG